MWILGALFQHQQRSVPIKSISAQKCMDIFISTWVARYGVLALISLDQGHQFTSAMWTGLHKML
jgi:hypothetical protein